MDHDRHLVVSVSSQREQIDESSGARESLGDAAGLGARGDIDDEVQALTQGLAGGLNIPGLTGP